MDIVNTEQLNKIIEDSEILLVDMYAEWCGPCKMLSPILEDISKKYTTIKVVKIDVDKNSDAAKNYNVKSVPTVLFFYNGKLRQSLVGFQPKARFEALLDPIV